jgi:hypothetical protein
LLEGFIARVHTHLTEAGARQIELVLAPMYIRSVECSRVINILSRSGYKTSYVDLDCALALDNASLLDKMQLSRRQRVAKCQQRGMVSRIVEPTHYRHVYEVIATNRRARGFPVSMTFEAIDRMNQALPGMMFFFGTYASDELIAASICIRINGEVLYVFYWGDLPGWGKFSPVTFLATFIYDFAKLNGFRWMDVGTSTVHGIPNHGLLSFKRELGCVEELKFTLHSEIPAPPAEMPN